MLEHENEFTIPPYPYGELLYLGNQILYLSSVGQRNASQTQQLRNNLRAIQHEAALTDQELECLLLKKDGWQSIILNQQTESA
ncbi:MAG: hypothetical protein NVSMB46_00120 [Candidatus Saccharimonadales bacterium]